MSSPKTDKIIHPDSEELLEHYTGFNEIIFALNKVVLSTEK